MRTALLVWVLMSCATGAVAQEFREADSASAIVLQEVAIASKQKTQQQNLYTFFSTNKAATTEDVMARFPELSLVRRGSYGMEPVIRSYNSSQVALLLDGMRIHGACTDKMDPASIYIEPENLGSLEVSTGGRSFINGSSIGGSINMKLATASCHEQPYFSGRASSGYHTAASAFFQSLNIDYATSRWGIRASGTYRKAHNYRDGSGKKVPYSQYEKVNYSLNGKWMLNDNTYLKADLLADDGWNIGYPALPMDVGYANARIGAVSIVKEDVAATWQKLEAKLYANKVKHYMDDTQRPDVPMHMDMPGQSFTTGFYAEGIQKRGSKSLTLRADAAATELKASMTMYQDGQLPMYMLTWPDNRQLQSGIAAQYTFRVDSLTQLTLNTRADFSAFSITSQMGKDQLAVFNHTGSQSHFFVPSFSVQVNRALIGKLKGTLSIGINGRTPTASELYGFYLFNQFDGYDYIGNPGLKQERGLLADLTLSYQKQKWKAQATGFVSKVSNYILGAHAPLFSAMTPGAKGVKQYNNLQHAWVAGAEASVVWSASKKTQLVSTLKYAWGKTNKGDPLPMMAPLRNISSVRQYFGNAWLQAELEAAAAQNNISKEAHERPTGSFALYHLRAGCPINFKSMTVQLATGVENLFDVYYREHLDWGHMARPGRNVYVQLSVGF